MKRKNRRKKTNQRKRKILEQNEVNTKKSEINITELIIKEKKKLKQ